MIEITLITTDERFSIHILGHANEDISKPNKDCIKVSTFAVFLKILGDYASNCYLDQGRGQCSFSLERTNEDLCYALERMAKALNSNKVKIKEIDLY